MSTLQYIFIEIDSQDVETWYYSLAVAAWHIQEMGVAEGGCGLLGNVTIVV